MNPTKRSNSLSMLSFGSFKRSTTPGPPSPTFSDATQSSQMNFGGADPPEKIITRLDLKQSVEAYEQLMSTSASYRASLTNMAKATAAFADAMSKCSGLKGPLYEAGSRLLAASGLHHLMSNQWHVLAETLDQNFEKPLLQHLENYREMVNDRTSAYDRILREKSQLIRHTETRYLNKKQRNLQSFRDALAMLQRQVDEVDELKAAHYHSISEHEEEVWDVVQSKTCVLVRSTMDVFDKFTSKASDPVIEPMLQSVPDPFDAYGPPKTEDQIFSILAPLSIMGSNPHRPIPTPSPHLGSPGLLSHDRFGGGDGIPTLNSKSNSWLPSANIGLTFPSEATEWATTASTPTFFHPTKATSPSVHSKSDSESTATADTINGPSRRFTEPEVTFSATSYPPVHMAESKLRSVLSGMESTPLPRLNLAANLSASSPKNIGNINASRTSLLSSIYDETSADVNYPQVPQNESFSHDESDPGADGEQVLTPRHATIFQESPPIQPTLSASTGSPTSPTHSFV